MIFQVGLLRIFPTHFDGYRVENEIARCRRGWRWSYLQGGCTRCRAGKYQAEDGRTGCYKCPAGKWAEQGAPECKAKSSFK